MRAAALHPGKTASLLSGQKEGYAIETRRDLQRELDQAIDTMDMDAVGELLGQLAGIEPTIPAAEDSRLFAARVKQLEKEREPMKMNRTTRMTLIAAAVAASLSVGVYAANNMSSFTFERGGRLVHIQGDGLTEQDAKEAADSVADALKGKKAVPQLEISFDSDKASFKDGAIIVKETEGSGTDGEKDTYKIETAPSVGRTATLEETSFRSVEDGERAMNLKLAKPDIVSKMEPGSAAGIDFNGNDKYLRAAYGSLENGKAVQITLERSVPTQGETKIQTQDVDPGSTGSYQSARGFTFTTASESEGGNTMRFAVCPRGYYTYTIGFFGFSEQEIRQALDTIDLSIYG